MRGTVLVTEALKRPVGLAWSEEDGPRMARKGTPGRRSGVGRVLGIGKQMARDVPGMTENSLQ